MSVSASIQVYDLSVASAPAGVVGAKIIGQSAAGNEWVVGRDDGAGNLSTKLFRFFDNGRLTVADAGGGLTVSAFTTPGILHNNAIGVFSSSLIVDADVTSVAWTKVTSTPTTLGGYGITDAVPATRNLTGSGAIKVAGDNSPHDLSVDRTISVASATASVLGVVQLAQDLAGSATNPIVAEITGVSNAVLVHADQLTWDAGPRSSTALVELKITPVALPGGTAASFLVTAQNNTGTAGTGGSIGLVSGKGHGNGAGNVFMQVADTGAGDSGLTSQFSVQRTGLIRARSQEFQFADTGDQLAASFFSASTGSTGFLVKSTVPQFGIQYEDGNAFDGDGAPIVLKPQKNTSLVGAGGSTIALLASGPSSYGSFTVQADDFSGAVVFQASYSAGTGPNLGFFGHAPASRPGISGSRSTDTWRQNLMTALASIGLVTDSSTA